MKYLINISFLFSLSFAQDFYYEFGQKVELKKNEKKIETKNNADIQEYQKNDGTTVLFRNEIVVVCENKSCLNDINNYNYEKLSSKFYLIKVRKNENIFKISQKLYEKENIKTATPNFVKKRVKR